jgi:hypothetical protein
MAINYTTLLGLAQPVTGTEANTWGDVVNDEITALLDSAIAGTATISVTAGNVTLTSVDGAADQARMAILVATGTPGVARNIVAPAQSKSYIVVNQSDSSVILKGSATTGVAVRAGQAATCVWNGTDFEIAASGDVDGPSSATNTAIAIFDGTTGKLIKNTGVTIDGSNNVSGVVQLNATTVAATTVTATTGNITTVNATTVDTTNIEVTNIKAKDGTAAGSIADATGVVTLASSVLTTTDINGGTIDGVTIGGAVPGAGTFTTATATTGNITTVNATTVDTTNIEVTNIKAKDGTASTTIADSTGVVTISTQLNVDNLRLDGNTVISTDTNGNIDLTPNGSGEVNITKVDIDSGTIDGTSVGATTASTGAFTDFSASGTANFSSTGSVKIPVGTTAQRPTPAAGMLRFNDDSDEFEGYNGTAWASVGGSAISNDTSTATDLFPSFLSATTGTAASIFTSNAKLLYKPSTGEFKAEVLVAQNGLVVNSATIDTSYSIPSGSNAMSAGPITVSSGVTVTVPSGSVWTIV